jgi:hypothetical protein
VSGGVEEGQTFPLRERACDDCPFVRKISQAEAKQLYADFPWTDPARPFLCHMDGEFLPGPETRCRGAHLQAIRHGYLDQATLTAIQALPYEHRPMPLSELLDSEPEDPDA